MLSKSIKKQSGFSLIELLLVVSVLAFVTFAVDELLISTYHNYQYTSDRLNAEQEARISMETISKELRQAITINAISSQSITFLKYENLTDTTPVKIDFYRSNSELIYKKTLPSGIAPNITYPTENETIKKLSTNLIETNTTIFVPYNELNQSINYSSIGSIKMVGISVKIDMNFHKSPPPFQLDSLVQIRNLKTN